MPRKKAPSESTPEERQRQIDEKVRADLRANLLESLTDRLAYLEETPITESNLVRSLAVSSALLGAIGDVRGYLIKDKEVADLLSAIRKRAELLKDTL